MRIKGMSAAVTGGASGLGLATAKRLSGEGVKVTIIDLPTSAGAERASELADAQFVPADITNTDEFSAAIDKAAADGDLRAFVHCAGRGRKMRVLNKQGAAGSLDDFTEVINLNLIGSFNAIRLAAAKIAELDEIDGERGAIVLTASVAAYEGQIGQINYSAAKSGIIGMTLTAARDLASRGIRVCTIAPGIMDTPALGRVNQDILDALGASVPHPRRLGRPDEFAMLASQIIENPYLNGETIRSTVLSGCSLARPERSA